MHVNAYEVLYSQRSHQHVSAAITAIFMVMFLLQEYKSKNLVNRVAINP